MQAIKPLFMRDDFKASRAKKTVVSHPQQLAYRHDNVRKCRMELVKVWQFFPAHGISD
jgi:hypothetical protein